MPKQSAPSCYTVARLTHLSTTTTHEFARVYISAARSKSVNITIEKRERVLFCVLGPSFRRRASWLNRHKTLDLSLLARKVHEPQ
jgi:hypothetical protein